MTTSLKSDLVELSTTRILEDKFNDIPSALDFGADPSYSISVNTNAITQAAAATQSGFVIVPYGITYDEATLTIPENVTILVFGQYGTVTFLCNDQGTSPIARGGIGIKSKGNTGVILRNTDFGVSAEPMVQVVDATNGDLAAANLKFIEVDEITDPTAPGANKARLYCKDNGAGKTQLVVRFPTGAVQQVAIEP